MKKVSTISDVRDNIQTLETSIFQCLGNNPPDQMRQKLNEAKAKVQKCKELCNIPLRLAIVGEAKSGKSLLLNALLDSTDICPCTSTPTPSNLVELKLSLTKEEKPPQIKSAQLVFLNEREVWEILNGFLNDISKQGVSNLPKSINSTDALPKLEDSLFSAFDAAKNPAAKVAILSALEYVMAVKQSPNVVIRENAYDCEVPNNLLPLAVNSAPRSSQDIQAFYSEMQQLYESAGSYNMNDPLNEQNLKTIFPLIKKVIIEASAWSVPFGVESPENFGCLAILNFPGIGADTFSAKDRWICTNEIKDAHAVLAVVDGASSGGSDVLGMSSLIQQAGRPLLERTLIVVNHFDEVKTEGKTAAISNILNGVKNLMTPKSQVYLCSDSSSLFDVKAQRNNWKMADGGVLSDSKKQASYSLYKRSENDIQKMIQELEKGGKSGGESAQIKQALEKYLDGAGITALREDMITISREKGEKAIKDNAVKEFNSVCHILEELAPQGQTDEESKPPITVNSEVTFHAQEFYRTLELAVADALPNGQSEYKSLKIKDGEQDASLWNIVEKEIASQIASWPEWFAILNQGQIKQNTPSAVKAPTRQPQKIFDRYNKLKKTGCSVPTEFSAFNERYLATAEALSQFALERISSSVLYSVQRFENHPDYLQAVQSLQSVMDVSSMENREEAMPILDAWKPSRMVEQEIVSLILERIGDEVEDLKNIRFPYDAGKPCFWNLALIVRIQVQLIKTLRDRVSRLIASAETNFQTFFVNEVLRAEILPLVRSSLNNPEFLASVSGAGMQPPEEPPENQMGRDIRSALKSEKTEEPENFEFKANDKSSAAKPTDKAGKTDTSKNAPKTASAAKPTAGTKPAANQPGAKSVTKPPAQTPPAKPTTGDAKAKNSDDDAQLSLDDKVEEW